MGQKINPTGLRVGVSQLWHSRWYAAAGPEYSKNLLEDLKIRKYLDKKLAMAGIVTIDVERLINKMKIVILVTRPGVVIGRGGAGLEELKKKISTMVGIPEPTKNVQIEVVEVANPDLSARIIGTRIAADLSKRMPHRRVIKRTIERVMSSGAKGVKVVLSGRIGGAEIGRRERFAAGKIPLGTIRANIDYASTPALTKSGYVGVKVWIYKD